MRKPPKESKESLVKVASVEHTEPSEVEKLLAEVSDLRAKLAEANAGRSEAERAALAASEAQMSGLIHNHIQEMPTGKTIKVPKCTGYKTVGYKDDGRPILRPEWSEEEVPTFFYKIDLPPVGGIGLFTNGVPLYHGTVYELDLHTLRDVKSRVWQCWNHEASIHKSEENAYRRPLNPVLSGGERIQRIRG